MLLPSRIIPIILAKDVGERWSPVGKGRQQCLNDGKNRIGADLWVQQQVTFIDIKKEEQGRQLGDANDTTTV